MSWERIVSKDNKLLRSVSKLASSGKYRRETGLYVCEGLKLLKEALRDGVEIGALVWDEEDFSRVSRDEPELAAALEALQCRKALVPGSVYSRVSTLENYTGPIFACRIPDGGELVRGCYIALDGVQDPGNIGTVLRTAEAFGIDGVILLEDCADVFQPKCVRAAMGSLFRQKVFHMSASDMFARARFMSLPVFAAALYGEAQIVGQTDLSQCIVIIGSEGRGVRPENIENSDAGLFIPMQGRTESLNAAVAASVIMWEMRKCLPSTGSGSAD